MSLWRLLFPHLVLMSCLGGSPIEAGHGVLRLCVASQARLTDKHAVHLGRAGAPAAARPCPEALQRALRDIRRGRCAYPQSVPLHWQSGGWGWVGVALPRAWLFHDSGGASEVGPGSRACCLPGTRGDARMHTPPATLGTFAVARAVWLFLSFATSRFRSATVRTACLWPTWPSQWRGLAGPTRTTWPSRWPTPSLATTTAPTVAER